MGTKITTQDVQYASNRPKQLAEKLNTLGGGAPTDLTSINSQIKALDTRIKALEAK